MSNKDLTEKELSYAVIGCAIKVHTAIGPGLLESAYEACLFYELEKAGFSLEKQVALPFIYGGVTLEVGYRIDLLVENKLIVEIKAIENFNEVHYAQLLTYLRLSNRKLGLLINFNEMSIKDGIKRVVNDL